MAMHGTSFTLRFALALACFAVANGTDEQVKPDSDTPLAPTGKDEDRQLRTELEQMRTTMKATEERHGKEIAKLKTLINATVQSESRAANAELEHRRRSTHRRHGITDVLSTPVMLASCEKSWPFQLKGTDKTIHVCVKCNSDAPLPYVIGRHGKQLIWACDATKFKEKALCRKSLSWLLNQDLSETGGSAEITCGKLEKLIEQNDIAAKLYSEHSHDLKLSNTAKLTSVSLYVTFMTGKVLNPGSDSSSDLATTRMQVEKTVRVAYKWMEVSLVFTVLSHNVRACGYIPEQPLQCIDIKQSTCIWSEINSNVGSFKSGQELPRSVSPNKEELQDQPCGQNQFLALATSRKL